MASEEPTVSNRAAAAPISDLLVEGAAPTREALSRASLDRPSDMYELKALIVSKQVRLTEDGVRVVDLALRRPEIAAFGTIKSMAAAGSVSEATIFRSIQKFGFRHFADFREIFRLHLRERAKNEMSAPRQN